MAAAEESTTRGRRGRLLRSRRAAAAEEPAAEESTAPEAERAGCRRDDRCSCRRRDGRGDGSEGRKVKEFLEYVARALVDKPDAVQVEVEEDDDEVSLMLTVDQEDMGRVIGRDGTDRERDPKPAPRDGHPRRAARRAGDRHRRVSGWRPPA